MQAGADDVHEGGLDAVAELHVRVGSPQLLCRPLGQAQLGGPGALHLLGLLLQVLKAWRETEGGHTFETFSLEPSVDGWCGGSGRLTGDEGVDVPGLGGHVGGTHLAHLHQQGSHVVVEGGEGLAEGHQARQRGHEEGEALGPGQVVWLCDMLDFLCDGCISR